MSGVDNMTVITSATGNSDEKLVTELRIDLKKLKRPLSRERCIYRVPSNLRQVNEAAYTPQFVSIGPLHYGNENLEKMEKHKLSYLKKLLDRAEERGKSLEDFVGYVKENEERIRCCYAETFDNLDSNQFARIILVDAAFIIEHIFRCLLRRWRDEIEHRPLILDIEAHPLMSGIEVDPLILDIEAHPLIFDIPFLVNVVLKKDMVLLENQLPFFVLEGLHRIAFLDDRFSHNSHSFFMSFNKQEKPMRNDLKHFTDLIRYYQLPDEGMEQTETPTISTVPDQMEGSGGDTTHCSWMLSEFPKRCSASLWKVLKRVPRALLTVGFDLVLLLLCQKLGQAKGIDENELLYSATQLDEAGVRFQAWESKCLFDIKFTDKGELEMSCLTIDDNTEALFRNVMALEQCHYLDNSLVCHYFLLIDSLINTDKDVDLLVENKILDNKLGSSQRVASLVNKLGLEITYTPQNFPFSMTIKKLNEHYAEPMHKSKAALRHGYFKTPWRRASTIAAIIILVLTLAQTISSFLSLGS